MKKVWCYTWSVPPCPDEALSGDSLSTKTWPRSVSSRGEAWPHLSSVACCRSRFPGSFPQLSSSLEYPVHVPVPAAGRPVAGWCQQPAVSSAAPHPSCQCWEAAGACGAHSGRGTGLACCSFTTHLRN